MRVHQIAVVAAFLGAAALTACGGGGSSTAASPIPGGAAPKATTPPAASARTSVATGKLTLTLPKAIRAKKTASAARKPGYINPVPSPLPSAGVAYNILDIYVDGTLIPNIDGNFSGNDHSMSVIDTNGSGTQTNIQLPLYSTGLNLIVAVERDYGGSSILAIGETQANGSVSAGGTVNLTLTMQMNAQYVAIVDLPNLSNPQVLSGGSYSSSYINATNTPSQNSFAVFPADLEGVLVPIAGYGGTSPATVTNAFGPASVAQSTAGTYFVNFFGASCNSVNVTASAQNPAYAIYTDLQNNYWNYYSAYYSNSSAGPYQGIWNLAYIYSLVIASNFSNASVTGSANIVDSGC
jgi:hypothetical protein